MVRPVMFRLAFNRVRLVLRIVAVFITVTLPLFLFWFKNVSHFASHVHFCKDVLRIQHPWIYAVWRQKPFADDKDFCRDISGRLRFGCVHFFEQFVQHVTEEEQNAERKTCYRKGGGEKGKGVNRARYAAYLTSEAASGQRIVSRRSVSERVRFLSPTPSLSLFLLFSLSSPLFRPLPLFHARVRSNVRLLFCWTLTLTSCNHGIERPSRQRSHLEPTIPLRVLAT